jgi:PGF-pre-PGF domain-containing protein
VPKLSNSSPGAITIYTPSPTSGTGSSTPTTITYSSATTSMSLYLNGVKNANNSINYGTESNFTAIISPSTDKVSLYVNGNEVVTLTSGKAIYLHTLAGGTYKVTASTDVSGVSNLTYYEKINQSAPSLYLNGVKNANTSINYGTESNFTAVAYSSSYFVSIYLNGTQIESLTKGSVTYLKILSAGFYNVTVVTNATGEPNVTYYERISKAAPTLTITDKPGNFTYNGTKDNSSALITTINSQLSASLYINGKLVSATNTRASYLNASAGTYLAVFNTTGNQNYSSYSVQTKSIISKAVLSQTLKAYPSSSFIYDGKVPTIQDTLNKSIVPGNSLSFDLENNSVAVVSTASSSEPFNFTALPGKYAAAGSYSYSSAATSNNNYTILSSAALPVSISKATPTMAVTDVPGNFTYNGTKDNSSALITTINSQLSASLYINGKLVSATNTRASYLNASAGTYLAVFNTTGNQNYSSYSVQLARDISKATPVLTLTSTPSQNYTQNGTSLIFHFSISTINNQLPADFYINGTLKNSSITTSGTYNAGDLTNIFNSVFNTTGNQNYTSFSTSKIIRILTPSIILSLFISGKTNNSSITYGTVSDFVVTSQNSFVSLYINGTLVTKLVKDNFTYLNILPAGYWKITAVSNSSNENVTLYQNISKAIPKMSLFATPGNFVYNGSAEEFMGNISTINNQIYVKIYINGIPKAVSNSDIFYSLSSAGSYTAELITNGNNNYTAEKISTLITISKAKPILYIKIPNNYTYTGESSVVYYSIFSINNQLTANVLLNDLRVNTINSAGKTYEINPGIYTFNISTTGNSNYTSLYLVKSYSIYKIKPVLINSNLISFNSSVLKVVLNESQISANSFLVKINKYTPGTLIVNLGSGISNLVGLSSLNLETNASASNQNLTINHLANTTCLGNSLKKPITFFSVIPSFNETTEKASAAYFFNISKNQLSNSSLSVQNISLYRCSPGDGWVELPTYLVKSINGTYYYKAYSDSLSLYAIAQGFAYNAENLSNFTNEFIDEIGLPLNYTWIATYNGLNQTQKAGLPMLFSNPYENYPAVFYNFSNSSSNITVSCTTVYYPTNVKASEPIIIPNGLSFTVHYSDLTSCEPIITAPIIVLTNTEVMFLALLFSVIMLLFIFISSMSFIKRKTK